MGEVISFAAMKARRTSVEEPIDYDRIILERIDRLAALMGIDPEAPFRRDSAANH